MAKLSRRVEDRRGVCRGQPPPLGHGSHGSLLLGGARDVVGRLLLVLMLVLHAVAQDRVVVAAREEVWKEMEERDDMWVVPHAWYRVRVHTGGLS